MTTITLRPVSHVSAAWRLAIDEWLTYLSSRTTRDTCTTHRHRIEREARHLGVPDPWAVTGPDLVDYFDAQPWQRETRRGHRTTIRGFYAWAVLVGHVEGSPALALRPVKPSPPNPMPVPDVVYAETVKRATVRELLMLRLAAQHGMRRAEIVQVHTRRDVIPDLTGWSLIVHGKGDKDRIVPLLDDVAEQLLAMPAGYAFPGEHQGHMSPRWCGTLINRLLPDPWTIHKLRHRAATRWDEASNHDLLVVSQLLGHSSVATTQLYVLTQRHRLRDTVTRAA